MTYFTTTTRQIISQMDMISVISTGKGKGILVRFSKGNCKAFIRCIQNSVPENSTCRVTMDGPISEVMSLKRKMEKK